MVSGNAALQRYTFPAAGIAITYSVVTIADAREGGAYGLRWLRSDAVECSEKAETQSRPSAFAGTVLQRGQKNRVVIT